MSKTLSAKEKSLRRCENLKAKLKYSGELLKEAEHRADLEEEEQEKWEGKAEWLRKRVKK